MAQRKRNRGHLAAAGPIGSLAGSALHSVDAHPPTPEGSIWGRRRVLLLNSTYEPLTALPMRRAGPRRMRWPRSARPTWCTTTRPAR